MTNAVLLEKQFHNTGKRLAVIASGVLVLCATTAEATWTGKLDSQGYGMVYSDGTWTITTTRADVSDGDGNTYEKAHVFYQITQAPEEGGDLDMSTLAEDCAGMGLPRGMYGSFSKMLLDKKVRSFKLPSSMISVSGWNARYQGNYSYNGFLTNVVANQGLKVFNAGFVSLCTNLVSVTGLDTVRHIGREAFDYCLNLKTIEPYLPTGLVDIAVGYDTAFRDCPSLTGDLVYRSPDYRKINECPGSPTSVTFCEGITNIVAGFRNAVTNIAPFPASLASFGKAVFYEMAKGTSAKLTLDFSACTNLTEFPQSFCGYSGVSRLILPPRIRKIGLNAFTGCVKLTNVTYAVNMDFRDEMLAANGEVCEKAFAVCTALQSITFPWGGPETTFGDQCLGADWSLRRVKFEGRPPKTFPDSVFDYCNGAHGAPSFIANIYASRKQGAAEWRAFTRPPTDEEKRNSTYPGDGKYAGVYEYDYSDPSGMKTRQQWVIWEKSCWDLPQGCMLLLR